jgi:hypothetical protein
MEFLQLAEELLLLLYCMLLTEQINRVGAPLKDPVEVLRAGGQSSCSIVAMT